jgi:Tol biopolymer transport system component
MADGSRVKLADPGRRRGPVTDVSPDGRYVIVTAAAGDSLTHGTIWVYDLVAKTSRAAFAMTNGNASEARVSPDGRWIAYVSDETGRPEVYVRPFLQPGAPILISAAGGQGPRWRGDSRELFFMSPQGSVMSIAMQVLPNVGKATTLFPSNQPPGGIFEVTADGQRFLRRAPSSLNRRVLTVVHNWKALLEGPSGTAR